MRLRVRERLVDRVRNDLGELRVLRDPAVEGAVAADRPVLAEHRPGAMTIRSPSRLRPCDTNGSGAQNASTWPLLSAVRIVPKPSARSFGEFGIDADLLQRRLDHHLADALERVHGDRLAGEVCGVRIELDP
jgi:hypothetical protein